MTESELRATIKKLNNNNYTTWKYKLELLLIKEDLWDIVQKNSVTDDVNWETKNNKAKAIIGLLLEDSQLVHVKKLKNAYEYWHALRQYHEKSTLSNKVATLKKLCRLKLNENSDMEQHLTYMTDLVDQLSNMGEDLAQNLIVAFMLSSLPESYSTIVMALETRPETDLTVEIVKEKLVQEYRRRNENQNDEVAMKINTNPKWKTKTSKICNFCNRRGHFKDQCWFYKKESEKENNKSQRMCNKPNNFQKRNNLSHTAKKVTSTSQEDEYEDNKSEENKNVCFTIGKTDKSSWYVDSAATCHISCNKEFFTNFNETRKNDIYLADGTMLEAKGIGNCVIYIKGQEEDIIECTIEDVLYIPEIDGNLLSVRKLTKNGYIIIFTEEECQIKKNNELIATAKLEEKLYKLKIRNCDVVKTVQNISSYDVNLLHDRFGHRDFEAIYQLMRNNLVENIKVVGKKRQCEVCIKGKMTRKEFPKQSTNRRNQVLDLVHTDICGPMQTPTPSGKLYFLTLIDDYSRYTHIYLLERKCEVFQKIKEYTEEMKNKFNKTIKVLRSDNGGEYISKTMDEYFKMNGIKHEFTAPYSPQQNGVAERKNRHLTEMANCMLLGAKLERKFWGEAIVTANYLQNRLPTKACGNTPYCLWEEKNLILNI